MKIDKNYGNTEATIAQILRLQLPNFKVTIAKF